MTLEELKVRAWDISVQINALQMELQKLANEIAKREKDAKKQLDIQAASPSGSND